MSLVRICRVGQSIMQRLLDNGASGLRFYTVNQSAPTLAILNNLQLNDH